MLRGFATVLALLAFPVVAGEVPLTIAFKDSVVVSPDVESIRLADILQVHGEDGSGCAKWLLSKKLSLASRNVPAVLTKYDVMSRLNRDPAAAECDIGWQGLPTLALSEELVPVDMDEVARSAAAALTARLAEQYQDVRVDPVGLAPSTLRAPNRSRFTIVPPAVDRVSRRMAVDVEALAPGHAPWRFPLWFNVSASRAALSVPRAISVHEDLTGIAVRPVMVDWAASNGTLLAADFKLDGYQSNRPIAAGTTLSTADIVRRPDIVAGDSVSVRVFEGPVFLETSAVALQSGFVGERITVRNERSQSKFAGTITRHGQIEVSP